MIRFGATFDPKQCMEMDRRDGNEREVGDMPGWVLVRPCHFRWLCCYVSPQALTASAVMPLDTCCCSASPTEETKAMRP